MTRTIRAIYEKGVFRPEVAVRLADGTSVERTVHADEKPTLSNDMLNSLLDEIAALPLEGRREGFSGEDHDNLYEGDRR